DPDGALGGGAVRREVGLHELREVAIGVVAAPHLAAGAQVEGLEARARDGVPDRVEAPRLDLPALAHARGVPVLAVLRVLDADPVGARLAREQVLRAPGEARALASAVLDPGEAPARVVAPPLDEAERVLDQRDRSPEGLVAALGVARPVDDAH